MISFVCYFYLHPMTYENFKLLEVVLNIFTFDFWIISKNKNISTKSLFFEES